MIKNNYKIKIFLLLLILLLGSFFIFLFLNRRYDIGEAPSKYNINTINEEKKYFKFLIKYLRPDKLKKFAKYEGFPFSMIKNYKSGYDALNLVKICAYDDLFYSLFDKNRINFEDCPVTKNFINKYNDNLSNYFKYVK